MAKGGRRPGAGRPKGSTNKSSRKMREAAAATGLLPHEIMLRLVRGEAVAGYGKATKKERLHMLPQVAPFYAPRLMAAALKVNPGDANPYVELMESVRPSRGLPAAMLLPAAKQTQ